MQRNGLWVHLMFEEPPMPDTNGRYRIQVVSELTGIPCPTLRAWERRYGIPAPARSAAAYRLYSDNDVAMVKRLRDLCSNGISIAEAAHMVKASIEGAATLDASNTDPFAVAVRRIVDAITAFDNRGVEREVARAQYLGAATSVFELVLAPVMHKIGQLTEERTLTPAHAHIATTVIGDTARAMLRLVNSDDSPHSVVFVGVSDEPREMSVLGAAMRVASWGITTVNLGNGVSPAILGEAVRTLQPAAVVIATAHPLEDTKARALLEPIAQACKATPWLITGPGAEAMSEVARHLGAVVIEGEFANARSVVDRIVNKTQVQNESAPHSRPGNHKLQATQGALGCLQLVIAWP
jgi:MerR family transcriptional regulator, light-induced transcriptional regulator